jgi:hypothetical protein
MHDTQFRLKALVASINPCGGMVKRRVRLGEGQSPLSPDPDPLRARKILGCGEIFLRAPLGGTSDDHTWAA